MSIAALFGWLNASYALASGLILGWFANGRYQPLESSSLNKWASLLLKIAIVILGFSLPVTELLATAKTGFGLTVAVIGGTLLIGLLLSKALKLNNEIAWLISSGTAICGGSAIAAIGSSIKASGNNMALCLAIVFILNAVALFLYPIIGHWLGLSQLQFGLWAAIGIHDTSSVVGAASQYGEEALNVATTTKLSRALWIIPVALLAAFISNKKATENQSTKVTIPWFIVLFIVASFMSDFLPLDTMKPNIQFVAKSLFALSLLWMGASLNKKSILGISPKAFILGIILWLLISIIGLTVIYWYF
nr:putative sulfate exporter family transporter [Kangiella sp. HZ709]